MGEVVEDGAARLARHRRLDAAIEELAAALKEQAADAGLLVTLIDAADAGCGVHFSSGTGAGTLRVVVHGAGEGHGGHTELVGHDAGTVAAAVRVLVARAQRDRGPSGVPVTGN